MSTGKNKSVNCRAFKLDILIIGKISFTNWTYGKLLKIKKCLTSKEMGRKYRKERKMSTRGTSVKNLRYTPIEKEDFVVL